jgi:OOP family OmpA-OmpF porin
MKRLSAILSLVLLLAFSGCASMDKRTKCIVNGAVAGAAIGAGSGAVIGHQGDTDNATEGAFIGAAVGGIIGGTIGCFICKAEVAVVDTDGDGVYDDADKCPGTMAGAKVDSKGCPLDSDGDGVPDYKDNCPGTAKGAKVDAMGCPLDSDGDGVPDHRDKCPGTPEGVTVDQSGCPLDSDGDGVYDHLDKCPDTPKGATVNERGCWAFKGKVFFDFNKSEIKSEADPLMKEAVNILEENPEMRIEIQGHTDSKGPEVYNQMLSEKRAMAVKAYLVKEGIDSGRLEVNGYGESDPIASNDTEEGRQKNRRVRFKRIN